MRSAWGHARSISFSRSLQQPVQQKSAHLPARSSGLNVNQALRSITENNVPGMKTFRHRFRPRFTRSPAAAFVLFPPVVSSFALWLPPIILLLHGLHRVLLNWNTAPCLKMRPILLSPLGCRQFYSKLPLFDIQTPITSVISTAFGHSRCMPVRTWYITSSTPRKHGLMRTAFVSSSGSVCGGVMSNRTPPRISHARVPSGFNSRLICSFGRTERHLGTWSDCTAPTIATFTNRTNTYLAALLLELS